VNRRNPVLAAFGVRQGPLKEWKTVKQLCCGMSLLGLSVLTSSAHAIGDNIRFTQAAAGTISATLSGAADPCRGSPVFPIGVISISRNGNEYDIASSFAVLDPPLCPDMPQLYEVAASLGSVPDGHYTVVWTIGPLTVAGAFDVRAGVLHFVTNAVPALTLSALSSIVAVIALIGVGSLRERRSRQKG
jgi:hypothetical protein